MDAVTELLLGRPIALLICWIVVQFVLICVWSARRDRLTARLVWLGFGSLAILQTIAFLIDTQSEQVVDVCRQMAKAIDEGEIAAVGAHLHPDFTAAELAKDAFLEAVAGALSRYRVDNPRLRRFDVEFPAPGEAVATFSASCRVRTPRSYGHIPSRWRAHFRQDGSQWRLTGLQALPVPPLHVSDLRQWLR